MSTTLLNPTLWLIAALVAVSARAAVRRQPPMAALDRLVGVATSRAAIVVLVVAALASVSTRLVLGYLAPGAYAEEVVQARALLAERQPGSVDARAELAEWLREEPAATDPWLLPGLTSCQAGALRERARFFSSQAHTPALVLASVPIVHVIGGRGLFVVLAVLLLASLAWTWRTLVVEAGLTPGSPAAWLLALALVGWQPVLAALRQGDAVLVAAALVVAAWSCSRRGRWAHAGLFLGLASVLALPALLVVPALARRPRALAMAVATVGAAALAVASAAGPVLLVDFARNVAVTTREYAEMPVNYAMAGRLLARLPAWSLAAGIAVAVAATIARMRRVDLAIAALCPLAYLAAPVAWSQHVALLLPPIAVIGTWIARRRSAAAFAGAAVALAAISLSDPAVTRLSALAWPAGEAGWPLVPWVVAAAWLALVGIPRRGLAGPEGCATL